MTKAEMESHRDKYLSFVSNARAAQHEGDYLKAVELAVSSWPHIDGMVQFERKHDKLDIVHLEGIEIVLGLAPYLLDFKSLAQLENLLKSQRRIDKYASFDLAKNLAKSLALTNEAYELWNRLEGHPKSPEKVQDEQGNGEEANWVRIAKFWESMGLIRRSTEGSNGFVLVTQMTARTLGKCSSCGAIGNAAKAKFLEKLDCPKCGKTAFFVILARSGSISN